MSSSPSTAIVVTTINDGAFLESYFDNLAKYDRLSSTHIYIIPDLKTPRAIYERAVDYGKRGLKVSCPEIADQDDYLRRVGWPPRLMRRNSDHRRNIGYLQALETGHEVFVSVDDDNLPHPDFDFVGAHAGAILTGLEGEEISSDSRFYNVIELMATEREGAVPIYPRGYPYFARHGKEKLTSGGIVTKPADINAGLWLRDPDVDAMTWLSVPTLMTGFKGKSAYLAPDTWCPINSQNTALRRDAMAAYYFLQMGFPMEGLTIDRYGDILQGYFVQACAKHLGGPIRFGTPVVNHVRNAHNYLKDVRQELACILFHEGMLKFLSEELKLEGATYGEAYVALASALEEYACRTEDSFWSDSVRAFFHTAASQMRLWVKVCHGLG